MKRHVICMLALFCMLFFSLSQAAALEKSVQLVQREGSKQVTTHYSSLQEALQAVRKSGAKITLLNDVEESVEYSGNYSLTLDFGGHYILGQAGPGLTHTGRGSLTLTGSGGIIGKTCGLYAAGDRGIVLQGGTYKATEAGGIAIHNPASQLTISGAVEAEGEVALLDSSIRELLIYAGIFQGTGEDFALQRTMGSLWLEGDVRIQGKNGGLLLQAGPSEGSLAAAQSSRINLGAGGSITAPAGAALKVSAAPGWDVTLAGAGKLQGDSALQLLSGALAIPPEATLFLSGKVSGGEGLSLQGGTYDQMPAQGIAGGLYAVKSPAGAYTLQEEPPQSDTAPESLTPQEENPSVEVGLRQSNGEAHGWPAEDSSGQNWGELAENYTMILLPKTGGHPVLMEGLALVGIGFWGLRTIWRRK